MLPTSKQKHMKYVKKKKKTKKNSNLQEHNNYLKTNPTDCLYLLIKNLVKKNNLAW